MPVITSVAAWRAALVLITDELGDIGYRLCWRRADEERGVLRRFLELAFEHAKNYEAAAREYA